MRPPSRRTGLTREKVGERDAPNGVGAYGFRLVFPEGEVAPGGLLEALPGAPEVSVVHRQASSLVDTEVVDDHAVTLGARGKGLLEVVREPASVTVTVPEAISPEALVHPLLTLPVALLAAWRGHATLHGGAFRHAGQAWVLTGEQTAGKSSALAGLGARGVPIVADDLVVVDGDRVLAGPDCVDLRPDAATRFPEAESIGVVAGRERYRLATPPSPPELPLGGIVVLEWGEEERPSLTPLEAGERLRLLHGQHYAALLGPPDPLMTMGLLGRPMWRLRRRRDWAGVDAAIEVLLDGVGAS